jgi:methionyl-tRNA formyltransferase
LIVVSAVVGLRKFYKQRMKLVLFGTGPFAVPTFQSLIQSQHSVVALVTRPIADAGKRRKTAENPCRDLGQRSGLTILDPPDANAPEFVEGLSEFQADLLVVCDYGQILSKDCLGVARKGGINLHGSLLPKYRGAAPINWAIYHGESITGVTIIHMTARLDGGPTLAKASLEIGSEETPVELEPRLAQLGVQPVHQAIQMLEAWDGVSPIGTLQDHSWATKAPRLKKSDGQIDWSRTAGQVVNQIRAFQPWPGTYSFLSKGKEEPERLIVHRASVVSPTELTGHRSSACSGTAITSSPAPGSVVFCAIDQLWVATGEGVIAIREIQPSGKRLMSIAEFLRGHRISAGDRFQ